ncbi:MAG: hypothetical protein LQ343_004966 [Gyalolechia ehrenbergii]|nr:MAG: hypothetical protein LQ343_004966 [Gyalolechia ehrenbergii]
MSDSPPGSPLSSHASSEFPEDIRTEDREQSTDYLGDQADTHLMPPSKRRKMGQISFGSTSVTPVEAEEDPGDISSDTSGSIPASELGAVDDDHHEQVTICRWEGCPAGDLGNMDELVQHIHNDHISPRQKKWTCQWVGCQRQGSEHASGYALRGHMRSHTKEKPFICFLPDALAKHLRTVHETDNLKPSDPVPKGHSSTQKPQRLKLVFNSKPPASETTEALSSPHQNDAKADEFADQDDDATQPRTGSPSPMPDDLNWTEEELSMTPYELFRKLRREVHWLEHDVRPALEAENERLEKKKLDEWRRKELAFVNWMEAELAVAFRNGENPTEVYNLQREFLPREPLPIAGPTPWYRKVSPEGEGSTKAEVGKWVEGLEEQPHESRRRADT